MTATLSSRVPRTLSPRVRVAVLVTVLVVTIVGGGAVGGALAVVGATAPGEPGERAGLSGANGFGEVFLAIVALNAPVAASLAAGAVTAGIFTTGSGLLLGLYLGATVTTATNTVGSQALIGSVAAYVGIEMLGLVMAAIAGFLPIANAVAGRRVPGQGAVRRYASALAPAGVLMLIALVLVLVGALIEAAVITGGVG
ncbi:hypothetical protein [Microbacterium oleivorans]|uniref:Uncharacterized protein n=1 Tax=Microbacterium oleivorans TaxID=273677 RepID=A0A7D5JXQ7_9MICO|nr:hypothetical protein [Microbacterium oleivorans]QLD11223.1 hypothetical protein HW566_05200 [Microbacterium oleivorans]